MTDILQPLLKESCFLSKSSSFTIFKAKNTFYFKYGAVGLNELTLI
jgi:hypothetical protein